MVEEAGCVSGALDCAARYAESCSTGRLGLPMPESFAGPCSSSAGAKQRSAKRLTPCRKLLLCLAGWLVLASASVS